MESKLNQRMVALLGLFNSWQSDPLPAEEEHKLFTVAMWAVNGHAKAVLSPEMRSMYPQLREDRAQLAKQAAPKPSLWENNELQFARVLAELEGLGTLDMAVLEQLAEVMDTSVWAVEELLDRAQYVFEESCAKIKADADEAEQLELNLQREGTHSLKAECSSCKKPAAWNQDALDGSQAPEFKEGEAAAEELRKGLLVYNTEPVYVGHLPPPPPMQFIESSPMPIIPFVPVDMAALSEVSDTIPGERETTERVLRSQGSAATADKQVARGALRDYEGKRVEPNAPIEGEGVEWAEPKPVAPEPMVTPDHLSARCLAWARLNNPDVTPEQLERMWPGMGDYARRVDETKEVK